jgi:hypothetical protein
LIDGLQIGEFIRLKGWSTFVIEECDSCCAAIWLAGTPRLMSSGAKIGFHAASLNGVERGRGNALFGAYMSRLGFGYDAIAWATTAAPTDIAYLTAEKAKELGIDLKVIGPDNRQATAPPPTPSSATAPAGPDQSTTALRDCSYASGELVWFFPSNFDDCDPATVADAVPQPDDAENLGPLCSFDRALHLAQHTDMPRVQGISAYRERSRC